jgi:hypothetical protein
VLEPFDEQATQFLQRLFVFFGKLKEHARVCYLRFKLLLPLNLLLQAAAFLQQLLRGFLIVPKVRRAEACSSIRFNSSRPAATSKKPPELLDARAGEVVLKTTLPSIHQRVLVAGCEITNETSYQRCSR